MYGGKGGCKMKAGWIGTLFFIWVVAMFLGSVNVGEELYADTGVTNPAQTIMSYTEVWEEEGWGTLTSVKAHTTFFSALFQIMVLNFPLFGGSGSPWQIVRWLVLGPIIATVVFAVVMIFANILRRAV